MTEPIQSNVLELSPDLSEEEIKTILKTWQQTTGLTLYSSPKQIFNLSLEEFKALINAQVDITALYLLECISNKIDILSEFPNSSKVKAWIVTLQRRGYITDAGDVSETGKQLLNAVSNGKSKSIKKELTEIENKQEDVFEKWWAVFPSTDTFTYKGRTFKGSRGLRVDKTKSRAYFDKIINEGEYTVDDMIRALNYEVLLKKEASLKEGMNKLQYLSASTAYLNQRKHESFMEISKSSPISEVNTSQYSGFDI